MLISWCVRWKQVWKQTTIYWKWLTVLHRIALKINSTVWVWKMNRPISRCCRHYYAASRRGFSKKKNIVYCKSFLINKTKDMQTIERFDKRALIYESKNDPDLNFALSLSNNHKRLNYLKTVLPAFFTFFFSPYLNMYLDWMTFENFTEMILFELKNLIPAAIKGQKE